MCSRLGSCDRTRPENVHLPVARRGRQYIVEKIARSAGLRARRVLEAVLHANAQVAAQHGSLGGEGHLVASGCED
jgi:hypothetical protein